MKNKLTLKNVANNYVTHTIQERGITLIALVITIIILIILATVSINAVLGEGGLIQRAQEAKRLTEQAVLEEQETLNSLINKIPDKNVMITFTVGSNSYTVEEGTTWEQWLSESGNSYEFSKELDTSGRYVVLFGYGYVRYDYLRPVYTDEIIESYSYYVSYSGEGGGI